EEDKSDKSVKTDSTKIAAKSKKDDLPASNVEVWHWQDVRIQPQQELTYKSDLHKNYLSVWHIDEQSFVQLGNEKYENIDLLDDEEHAVAYDATPYEPSFEEPWKAIYLIDVATGDTKKVLDKLEYVLGSPGGEYLYYFKQN